MLQAHTQSAGSHTPLCRLCRQVRFEVLSAGKTLLTPQPRLRTGFFSTLTSASFPPNAILEACTSAGVAKYGEALSLSDSAGLKVDMIVVGSSAVSRNGARLGKGEVSASLLPVSALSY